MAKFVSCVLFATLFALSSATLKITAPTSCEDFWKTIYVCDNDDQRKVTIFDQTLECADHEICNSHYIQPCQPCINATDLCGDAFTCNGRNVEMAGSSIECPQGMTCNEEKKDSCKPCIIAPCPAKTWTCDSSDPTKVTSNNLEGHCSNGSVCNKDNQFPCTPCIHPTGMEGSTLGTKSTETTDENVSSTITTTSKEPEFHIPDCNDGEGSTRPCREGPRGSRIYYRCIRQGNGSSFLYNILSCENLIFDRVCRRHSNYLCK